MMEIEIKLLLEVEERLRLERALGAPREIVRQRNRYFDDARRTLGRGGWGLRLREESSAAGPRAWLTFKHRGDESGAFVHRPEYERAVLPDELARLVGDPAAVFSAARALLDDPDLLPCVDPAALVLLGELANVRQRHLLPGPDAFVVELDRTLWPDGTASHELELELQDAEAAARARTRLEELFAVAGVAWRPGQESKLARLVRMLGLP